MVYHVRFGDGFLILNKYKVHLGERDQICDFFVKTFYGINNTFVVQGSSRDTAIFWVQSCGLF